MKLMECWAPSMSRMSARTKALPSVSVSTGGPWSMRTAMEWEIIFRNAGLVTGGIAEADAFNWGPFPMGRSKMTITLIKEAQPMANSAISQPLYRFQHMPKALQQALQAPARNLAERLRRTMTF